MFEKEEERVEESPRGMQCHGKDAEQGTLKPPSFSKRELGELWSLSTHWGKGQEGTKAVLETEARRRALSC